MLKSRQVDQINDRNVQNYIIPNEFLCNLCEITQHTYFVFVLLHVPDVASVLYFNRTVCNASSYVDRNCIFEKGVAVSYPID